MRLCKPVFVVRPLDWATSCFCFRSKMKLKERLLIGVLAGIVLLTVVLVLDVETRLTSGSRSKLPSHGRVQYSFRHRQLQRTGNASREAAAAAAAASMSGSGAVQHSPMEGAGPQNQGPAGELQLGEGTARSEERSTPKPHDPYIDLQSVIAKGEARANSTKRKRKHWNPSLAELLGIEIRDNATIWELFHLKVSRDYIYAKDDQLIDKLLSHVATSTITSLTQKEGGTQLKLIIEFADGGHALFKPMRFPREQETMKNQFYFTDFERHNAEVAAFHLDKLLGFRRAVPIVGRTLNMTSELYAFAQGELLKTFFVSPDNNLCFHGKCSYYCDTSHAICGNPDLLEGSFAVYLPWKEMAPRKSWRHPWRRSYSKRRKAQWEIDDEYCALVRDVHPFNEGRRLLDLVDMAVLDFLMGNMDRHHYETFKVFGNYSAPVHLDHGRGFGKAFHDEVSILAPMYQCCLMRHSTLQTLLRYHNGPVPLSEAMRKSMEGDPISPVLWEPHLFALDRRINIILQILRECVTKAKDPFQVVVHDFH